MPEISLFYGNKAIIEIDEARVMSSAVKAAQADSGVVCSTSRCTVMNDTLAWDINGNRDNTESLDIDPDTLYELPFVSEQIA